MTIGGESKSITIPFYIDRGTLFTQMALPVPVNSASFLRLAMSYALWANAFSLDIGLLTCMSLKANCRHSSRSGRHMWFPLSPGVMGQSLLLGFGMSYHVRNNILESVSLAHQF